MQDNFQPPGRLQNVLDNGNALGNRTSNYAGPKFHQLLTTQSAKPPYSGETTGGNYLTKFSTVQRTTSNQTFTGNTQSTSNINPAQENPSSKCMFPTGTQDSQIILWDVPPSAYQLFLPANVNVQGAINVVPYNNGSNVSNCSLRSSREAFNSFNNSSLQQNSSISVDAKSSKPFNGNRILDTKNLNETGRNCNNSLRSRQQHVTSNNLSKDWSKTRMNVPTNFKTTSRDQETANRVGKSPLSLEESQWFIGKRMDNSNNYGLKTKTTIVMKGNQVRQQDCLPLENGSQAHSSHLSGHANQQLITEGSFTHAPLQALCTFKQNVQPMNAAQKAVAIVTPLAQSAMAYLNVSNNSANMTHVSNGQSKLEMVSHQPNISYPLEASTNIKIVGEGGSTSKHQSQMSRPMRLNDEKSTVWPVEPTNQNNHTSTSKLDDVVAEQKEFVLSIQKQNEASEMMPDNNCAVADQTADKEETDDCFTVPVIQWSINKLHTLMGLIEEIDGKKSVHKTDAASEILKLYWDGDIHKLGNAVRGGMYTDIMKEVKVYCDKTEPVILRQIKTSHLNKVAKNFHILKHDEAPPKIMHESSWLNLDDTEKERGFSWFSCNDTPQVLDTVSKDEHISKARDMASTELITSDNESVRENSPISIIEQLPTVNADNCSPKLDVIAEQQELVSSSQIQIESNEKMAVNDVVVTDKIVTSETMKKPCIDVAVQINEEEIEKIDASIKNNVPSSETASQKQCFGSEIKEGNALQKEIVVPPEMMQRSSKLNLVEHENCDNPKKELGNSCNPLAALTDLVKTLKDVPCGKSEKQLDNRSYYDRTTDQIKSISSPKLAATAEPQDCAKSSRIQNESNKKMSNDRKPITEVLKQTTKEDASASIKINVLSHETAKQCFADEMMEDKDLQKEIVVPPEMMQRSSKLNLVEHENCDNPKKELGNSCNPLAALTDLVKTLKDVPCGKSEKQLDYRSYCVETTNQSNSISSPNLAVTAERQGCAKSSRIQNESNKKMSNDRKPITEVLKQTTEEDDSASIKINVLSHETAKRCFAGEVMEDKDLQKDLSLNDESDDTDTEFCCNEEDQSTTDTLKALNKTMKNMSENVDQPPIGKTKLDDKFCNGVGARSPESTETASQINCTNSPKLNAAEQEEYVKTFDIQNEPKEKMPSNDCAVTDKSVNWETELKPSTELDVQIHKERVDEIDALASIKINVLPYELAKLWFSGEMTEDEDLQKNTTVQMSSKDHIKVLDLPFDTEVHRKEIKSIESNNRNAVDEELEFYCCHAKWLQALGYVNGLCICEKETEVNENGTKIEVFETNSEVQINPENCGNGFSNECGNMKLEIATLKGTDEDASQNKEAKKLLMSHIDRSNNIPLNKLKIVKDHSNFAEGLRVVRATSKQVWNKSPSKCTTNVIKEDSPSPNSKETVTVHFSLYGSSSDRRHGEMPTKRHVLEKSCQKPPETLRIKSANQENEENRKSKKRNCVGSVKNVDNSDTSGIKRRLSFTTDPIGTPPLSERVTPTKLFGITQDNSLSPSLPTNKLTNPGVNLKSDVSITNTNKLKKKMKCRGGQNLISKYFIKGNAMPCKSPLQLTRTEMKSKYELGNPALMPLEEGLGLEFKVLPKSFSFTDGTGFNCDQADTSPSPKTEMSYSEEIKAKRMKIGHSQAQGAWCFSPRKTKNTQSIQTSDVSGSCSLFQEFKRKYQKKKKEIDSRQNCY